MTTPAEDLVALIQNKIQANVTAQILNDVGNLAIDFSTKYDLRPYDIVTEQARTALVATLVNKEVDRRIDAIIDQAIKLLNRMDN